MLPCLPTALIRKIHQRSDRLFWCEGPRNGSLPCNRQALASLLFVLQRCRTNFRQVQCYTRLSIPVPLGCCIFPAAPKFSQGPRLHGLPVHVTPRIEPPARGSASPLYLVLVPLPYIYLIGEVSQLRLIWSCYFSLRWHISYTFSWGSSILLRGLCPCQLSWPLRLPVIWVFSTDAAGNLWFMAKP